MADEDKEQEVQDQQPEPEEKAPDYVQADQFRQFQDQISGQMQQVTQQFQNLATLAQQQQQPQQQPLADVSEEDIERAIADGENVGKVVKQAVQAAEQRILQQYVVPLQEQGAATISSLTEEVVATKMPYYDIVKDDLRTELDKLEPGLKMRPEVLKHVYKSVVGDEKNIQKIVQREVEAALRKDRDLPSGDVAGNSRQTGTTGDRQMTAEDAFGAEGLKALKERGMSPEDFAKRLGYKDLDSYLSLVQQEEIDEG